MNRNIDLQSLVISPNMRRCIATVVTVVMIAFAYRPVDAQSDTTAIAPNSNSAQPFIGFRANDGTRVAFAQPAVARPAPAEVQPATRIAAQSTPRQVYPYPAGGRTGYARSSAFGSGRYQVPTQFQNATRMSSANLQTGNLNTNPGTAVFSAQRTGTGFSNTATAGGRVAMRQTSGRTEPATVRQIAFNAPVVQEVSSTIKGGTRGALAQNAALTSGRTAMTRVARVPQNCVCVPVAPGVVPGQVAAQAPSLNPNGAQGNLVYQAQPGYQFQPGIGTPQFGAPRQNVLTPFFTGSGVYTPLIPLVTPSPRTYLGQGIIGQPTAYVDGQPVRNLLRYVFP